MNVQRQSGANKIRPNPITSHMAKNKKRKPDKRERAGEGTNVLEVCTCAAVHDSSV